MSSPFASGQPQCADNLERGNRGLQTLSRFSSVADRNADPHLNGHYFRHNPTWHVEYSPWKATNVYALLRRNGLQPRTICEVGCGAGEVLRQLQLKIDWECGFRGYDIAPEAIAMAKQRENDRLHFDLADFTDVEAPPTDLLLIMEVVDHVEDYLKFLRMLKGRSEWKIFSFSLDISAQSVLRDGALLRRREVHSHLHHFNKETALAVLRHTGYEVIESVYVPNLAFSRLARLAKPIRRAAFALNAGLTVRMFGGYSLMVLAR